VPGHRLPSVARPITFLSDYGQDDEFAGLCRAVIAGIAPEAAVIDLTHGIRRHAVAEGAAVLAKALPYTPAGIHLAVVDPGVGSPRRAIAVRVADDDRILVGPDNGLLWAATQRLGGVLAAADVSLSPFRLEPVSATFHGRDVFAPVAAHLAAGATLEDAGEAVDPGSLTAPETSAPVIEESRVRAHVVYVDRYGNAALDLDHERLPATGLRLGRRVWVGAGGVTLDAVYSLTFSDVSPGQLILYEDSYRSLALAVNRGSAADVLDLAAGAEVTLRPA
jgi:S-adenosyl-L-methionine hydrolase (adenosine-forming)